ncbi:putative SEC14 cytosolic factor [Amylocarpus encephaloides]|uniref:SEC14 cytosolic factor n=1 Tax=Amylocarpus encephaloides TaxID=45428 RepID=A0A9P7YD46_9HELO|nr:putative SEC14 cytosolic factor [Amylocarpus encephaloides]
MSGPAHRVQSAVVEYGYPQGHLGHLSSEEEEALKNFKVMCAEKGYYSAGLEGGAASHEDATLLRFLRARRFIVPEAYNQFQETEDWRKANEIDKLYQTIDLEHYEETRRLYPQWTGRRDRRGIPVYVFEVKHLNSKTMAAYEKSAVKTHTQAKSDGKTSPKLLRLFALYENLIRFTMPLCTQLTDREHPRTPITQSNNIVDISGVGLKQFWNLRSHMQDASTLATAHYPETLDRIFIIGAPAFFPTVWGWIKKWFDPITTSKIFIISSHDMKKTLESFIDPKNIPKKYGGELEFHFGDKPVLDPYLKDVLKWEGDRSDFPDGPMYWEKSGKEEIKAVAVGTMNEGGNGRHEDVCVAKRVLPEEPETMVEPAIVAAQNGKAEVPAQLRAELLTVPMEVDLPSAAADSQMDGAEAVPPVPAPGVTESKEVPIVPEPAPEPVKQEPEPSKVVQEGEVIPATRPEPQIFHTAQEVPGLKDLGLDEKRAEGLINGDASHESRARALLDPGAKA